MADNYITAGNYIVSAVNLTNFDKSETLDIRLIIDSLEIEESIFTACISRIYGYY